MEAITLYELNSRVKQALKCGFKDAVWITAEITEMQLNRSGHCYLQLADKREEDDSIIATARGTIWAFVFRTLQPYFESVTGRALAKGMKVMLNVEVVFHELYGYSLNVKDIDPTYTVGDLERRRREILMKLEKEGVIDMNRELEFPLLPKTVAVISSPTAAGLGDFMNQLENNPNGYRFQVKLFPAVMQGEKTTDSVIAALDRINEYGTLFDVVVIIRGGGSQTDLGSFDSYELAANVAQFPLPIIAGIGHERDETIVDRVAHLRVKTPTAAAAHLIACFQEQEEHLLSLQRDCISEVQEVLNREHKRQLMVVSGFKQAVLSVLSANTTRLKLSMQRLRHASVMCTHDCFSYFDQLKSRLNNRTMLLLERQKDRLESTGDKLRQHTLRLLSENARRLELADNTVKLVDPKKVLSWGYSITRQNGKAVKNAAELKVGDELEIEMAEGTVTSKVLESKV